MNERARKTRLAGLVGWALFDWAAQPLYTLVLTFLFAAYFANVFVADSVRGQALWGAAIGAGGVAVALASPVLGAIADAGGRRKPWIFVFSLTLVAGLAGLWAAAPGAEARLPLVILCLVFAFASAEFAAVFVNAMMATLVSTRQLGRLSGIGWAAGYVGGLTSLLLLAGLLIADAESGRTLFGLTPLMPLDAVGHQGDRLVGPFSALWYVVFIVPFFLFTPDRATGRMPERPIRAGLERLVGTFREVRQNRSIALYLLAHMLYADGLGAVFAFGGIYAASLFGWTAAELGVFGILLTVSGAVGAAIGGFLDDRFGSRAVVLGALAGLMFAAIGIVSIADGRVLFVIEVAVAEERSAFASTGERVYLAFGVVIGLLAGPLQASSRSFMARLAPPGMGTQFFGLYAFSGKITAFAAPLLVGAVTMASGSQRAGIAAILVFLVAGFAVMLTVKERG
jgi:MFS transporter, UMF1 family